MRAKLPHTEGTTQNGTHNIHYEIYGEGDHTFIFLPSWSFSHSRLHKPQIPYFSEHFRCITFDPRGNGKSDRPTDPEAYRLKDYVGDALAVMDETGTGKAILFGFSISSEVAHAMASYYPERIEAVIVVGTNSQLIPTYDYESYLSYDLDLETYEGWQKFSHRYWHIDYPDFVDFFSRQVCIEPHSTKQIQDCIEWALETSPEILIASIEVSGENDLVMDEAAYKRIRCPMLIIHGADDPIAPLVTSEKVAELTNSELIVAPGTGHAPHSRYPAKFNLIMRDFLAKHLGTYKPEKTNRAVRTKRPKKALYLSSPIGLGHARRDLAISRELRKIHPDLQVDWLSQDPVTRFLQSNKETIHAASSKLANESTHIEEECGEHDLNTFQALRNMDEILLANFMVFQEVLEEDDYDLVIADEAWDVDQFWHEHPELKQAQVAWLTDFVGFVPMPGNGDHEAFLTSDYNSEMIEHIRDHPEVRDRSIFVGNPADVIPMSFGKDLPNMRDWVPEHFDFCGYVLGEHPDSFGEKADIRTQLGYRNDEKICIVTVGGSGVGGALIRRILAAYPIAKRRIPELRMIVVMGPRLSPEAFDLPEGVEAQGFVPDLDRHLAACDLALVQGGLTTTMELTDAGTPFLYFPLKNHFEQNFHVAHRLDQYGAGRKMIFDESDPDRIAEAMVDELAHPRAFRAVEADGANRAARMLSDLL
jgi:pimeloyl-ACP methyl ester carboxylesterase/predicted glycosyltransferase